MLKLKIEVQFFLEFTNFYKYFIKRYFRIILLLTNLTRKNILFMWIEKAEETFKKLKKLFIFQSVLIMFESEKLITLKMNVSDEAIEACINQSNNKRCLHLIAFHSRKFTNVELNYKIHDKKLLAIVDFFKQWRMYLKEFRHQIQVYTDHKNLLYFTITKVLNWKQIKFNIKRNLKTQRLTSWAEEQITWQINHR